MEVTLRVVRYIKRETEKGMFYKALDKLEMTTLISWKLKKHHIVARSSVEAKYKSMVIAVSEIIWLLGVFEELGVKNLLHVKFYCDNKATLQIVANLGSSSLLIWAKSCSQLLDNRWLLSKSFVFIRNERKKSGGEGVKSYINLDCEVYGDL
ncbi:uncharacterized protein LOC120120052 [Hibiscus syriacus]|uniref:uncharacterized protein LOC120120052 n=1 Tax=Hibiscus syriacus TaxID=106335 RepID=UPI001922599D|nr:uncharacterized protein LOC120120052 [Hibiscus syriacus]